jgi:murein DD-endopeptidase MepM/ murein hydrolase activator NlpD
MPIGSTPDMLVVLDDHPSSRAGMTIAQRYARGIVTLAAWDVATDHVDGEVRTSITAEPSVAEAFRVASRQRAPWIAIRRDFADPQQLLGELLLAAAQHADEEIPGYAVLLADGDPGPFHRLLAIVDRGDGPISGLLAYIAVSVANRSGAELDVLVIGPGPADDAPVDSSTMLALNREQELLDRARARAEADDLTVNWITLTTEADPWAVISDQLGQYDYDLVIDDLGDISLGRPSSVDRAISATVSAGQIGAIPLRLLSEVPVPLLLVIDEIRLGIAPASVLKLGTVAAIALGIVSTAALTSTSQPVAAQTITGTAPEELAKELAIALGQAEEDPEAVARAEERSTQAATSSRGGDVAAARTAAGVAAESDEQADTKDEDSKEEKASKPKPPKGGADPADVRKAEKAASKDREEYQKDKKKKDKAKKTVAEAEEAYGSAQEQAEAALAELNAATLSYAEAEQQAEEVQASASGLTGLMPGSPDDAQVQAAQEAELTAQLRLDLAMASGTVALDNLAVAEAELAEAEEKLGDRAAQAKETKAEYEQAKEKVEVYKKSLAKTRQSPVSGGYNLTARYGNTGGYWSSGVHTGLDFAAPMGTDITAAASGTVTFAGWEGSYGNKVVIDHGNGYTTTYSHLSDIDVSKGQKVQTGDHIGDMGSTGNSTGSHLHFEVLKNDKFMDPETWLGW